MRAAPFALDENTGTRVASSARAPIRGDFERARIGNRCALLAQPRIAKLQYFSDGHCL